MLGERLSGLLEMRTGSNAANMNRTRCSVLRSRSPGFTRPSEMRSYLYWCDSQIIVLSHARINEIVGRLPVKQFELFLIDA